MLTAFNVLGMHAKKAEVEAMLAEVDADGSGEVILDNYATERTLEK